MTEEGGDIKEAHYRALVSRPTFLSQLQQYNLYFKDGRTTQQLKLQEVKGLTVVSGVLKLYWGTQTVIKLKKEEPSWKRRSIRLGTDEKLMTAMGSGARNRRSLTKLRDSLPEDIAEEENGNDYEEDNHAKEEASSQNEKFITAHSLPRDGRHLNHDIITEVERAESNRGLDLNNVTGPNGMSASMKKASNLRRRTLSFSGHNYNGKTRIFRPRYGTVSNVRVSSMQSSQDVIKLLLNKFAVENPSEEFSLFSVSSSHGTQELKTLDFPLLRRIQLGPDENVAKIFVMEKKTTQVSMEVAQYTNLSFPLLEAILRKFTEEEEKEILDIRKRYSVYHATLQKKIEALTETKKTKKKWWKT